MISSSLTEASQRRHRASFSSCSFIPRFPLSFPSRTRFLLCSRLRPRRVCKHTYRAGRVILTILGLLSRLRPRRVFLLFPQSLSSPLCGFQTRSLLPPFKLCHALRYSSTHFCRTSRPGWSADDDHTRTSANFSRLWRSTAVKEGCVFCPSWPNNEKNKAA
jgi:hypothetical protein